MNDTQIALLGFGGGAILLMVVYNWWQDWRARKQNKLRFDGQVDDALLDAQYRAEPTMHVAAPQDLPGQSLPAQFNDNMLVTSESVPSSKPTDVNSNQGIASLLNESLHAVFYINFEQAISVDYIHESLSQLRRAGNKPVRIACLAANALGDSSEQWLLPAAGLQIITLRLAVQLANRKGPLTAIEYSEFVHKLEQFSERFEGDLELLDMAEIVARAERLDKQAASLDTLLGMHCVLPEAVEQKFLQEELEHAGWVNVGRSWWLAEGDQPLASVVIHDTPGKRVLSFSLDVPNALDPVRALDSIASIGGRIAQAFQGALMDDAGRVVTSPALNAIRQQLRLRAQSLAEAGFSPGSLAARMLFASTL